MISTKVSKQPVKIAKRNQPPHQSDPANPIETGRASLFSLVLSWFCQPSAGPCRLGDHCRSLLLVSAVSMLGPVRGLWHGQASLAGSRHPAIGTDPGSALSLNSMGSLRSRRCFSTYAFIICAATRAASLPCSPPSKRTATTISGFLRGVTPANQLLSLNCLLCSPLRLRNVIADQLCASGFAGKVYTLNVRAGAFLPRLLSTGIHYARHRVSDGNPILGINGHAHHVWHGLRQLCS